MQQNAGCEKIGPNTGQLLYFEVLTFLEYDRLLDKSYDTGL